MAEGRELPLGEAGGAVGAGRSGTGVQGIVGREREREAAREMLLDPEAGTPLLTLVGPGGVGKTRLAQAIAVDLAPHFADGIIGIDLAPLAEPELLAGTVASALGVAAGEGSLREAIVAYLRPRQLLLVLDNCEHLAGPSGEIAAEVLAMCPAVQVLATSRTPLRVRNEQILPVAPLAVEPEPGALELAPAVALFVQRARAVQPAFDVSSPAQAALIAEICARLDGLPLAIELAAARVRALPLPRLLERLEQRLPLLTDGPRDAPARHQALRETIAWSYDLLPDDARRFFRWLTPYAGGFTLEAAEWTQAAMRDDPRAPVTSAADLLLTLSDQSLLAHGPNSASRDRYTLLETIREFGLEQLAAHNELEAARSAQAAYVRDLVSRAQMATGDGIPDQGWVARLDDERGNIRAALYWWIKRGDSEPALATAGALVNYWWMRSDFGEGRSWCERALSLAMTVAAQSGLESSLYGACVMASNQGDHARALEAGRAMLREAQARDAPVATIRAHYALCRAARRAGEADLALEHALAALALARENVEPIWQAWVLSFLAESPDIVGPERAEAAAHEALAHFREQRSAWGQANTLQSLALFAVARGELESAMALLDESLTWREQVGERTALVEGLACVADIAVRHGRHEGAAILLGAIQAWGGVRLDAPAALDHLHLARTVTATRQALPLEQFAWRRAEGAALTRREALATARTLLREISPVSDPLTYDGVMPVVTARRHEPVLVESLTRREQEVLGLLAERLSDAEIASRLFIGTRTAEFHVANINSKLGAANRREATAIAARMGLL